MSRGPRSASPKKLHTPVCTPVPQGAQLHPVRRRRTWSQYLDSLLEGPKTVLIKDCLAFSSAEQSSTCSVMHRQQHDRQRRDWSYEQQPAHLATTAPALLGAAVDGVTEEGELPPEPHPYDARYRDGEANAAYQWQMQQQYGAYPSELNQQQYGEAYQQAQDISYNQPHQYHTDSQQQQQQHRLSGAAGAAAYEEKDFNTCDTFFGPWPGFCFKLGYQGLGYYRDTPPAPAAAATKPGGGKPSAKPKVILGNNSIIKGLAPKPGGVVKRRKSEDTEKPAYLREMEAWQRQACSDDDARRSLVK